MTGDCVACGKSRYLLGSRSPKKKSAEPGTAQGTPTKAHNRTMQGRHPFGCGQALLLLDTRTLRPRLVVSPEAELDSHESFRLSAQPMLGRDYGSGIPLRSVSFSRPTRCQPPSHSLAVRQAGFHSFDAVYAGNGQMALAGSVGTRIDVSACQFRYLETRRHSQVVSRTFSGPELAALLAFRGNWPLSFSYGGDDRGAGLEA